MKPKLSLVSSLLLCSIILCGCKTTITNLTPGTQKRAASGLYPFEVELDTREQAIQKDTLKPYVLVGSQQYPMQPTLGLKNRWETVVPISPDKEFVNYRYKFDYEYLSIPKRSPGSKLSPPYQIQILDK